MAQPRRQVGGLDGGRQRSAPGSLGAGPDRRCSRDALPLSLAPSNKPNPNQISVNNLKAGVVNGAGAPGQSPGAGRACESCYSKCPGPGPPQPAAVGAARPRTGPGGGAARRLAPGEPCPGHGCPAPGGRPGAGDSCVMLSAVTGSA